MSYTTPYTALEAVNDMLMGIGQSPVNSITNVTGDPLIASAELAKMVRYVLLYGFAFNTDREYVLTPDISGNLLVPQGVLKITASDRCKGYVIRKNPAGNMALWDQPNQTWTFPAPDGVTVKPYTFEVVWGFDFESLPEIAKNFIALSSARRFQRRVIGSAELDQYMAEDESKAWSLLLRDERNVRDTNQFRQSPSLQRAVYNRIGGNGWPMGPQYD